MNKRIQITSGANADGGSVHKQLTRSIGRNRAAGLLCKIAQATHNGTPLRTVIELPANQVNAALQNIAAAPDLTARIIK